MSSRAVVNASPLIYTARADLFHLLRFAAREIVVPQQVAFEIMARGDSDVTARCLKETEWLNVVEAPPVPPQVQPWGLGKGESSVIAWALAHPGCRAVIDDLEGRRCAEKLGIPLRGTLGLVLRARRDEAIPKARPILERLRAAGMYLSDKILDTVLAEVGE